MIARPLLSVENLSVVFRSRGSSVAAVRHLSFDIDPGETLAIVGESGSGKSVTALSLMRLIEREGGVITSGSAVLRRRGEEPVDLLALADTEMPAIRGNAVSMIFQEPMTSLNPVLTIGEQIGEVLMFHRKMGRDESGRAAADLLDRVQMTDPKGRLEQYPHELSGGMRQRVMIAIALACEPLLLIADEPTTALDVTIQAGILDLLDRLREETGMAMIFITHDMGVVAEIADRVIVMRHGEQIEVGPTAQVLTAPRAGYTRALLEAVPRLGSGAPVYKTVDPRPHSTPSSPARSCDKNETVLDVQDLVTRFPIRKGPFRWHVANVHAVEGVSLALKRGETLGLVGESGSGKSTIARSILKLVAPTSGRILLEGRDVVPLSPRAMRPLRREAQMVFQDPYASLNPRLNVNELVTEPLVIHEMLSAAERRQAAAELLRRVGLSPDHLDRHPHQFSGGQRQRLCIARALACRPRLIIADEPVSALDVSVQAQVLDLMRELQSDLAIAYLFISHDLGVIEQMSHRIAVLDRGRIVETGPTNAVLADPGHAYTRALLASVPSIDGGRRKAGRLADLRERESPINVVGYRPPPQDFEEIGVGHFIASR